MARDLQVKIPWLIAVAVVIASAMTVMLVAYSFGTLGPVVGAWIAVGVGLYYMVRARSR
jgi:hypothetical protein